MPSEKMKKVENTQNFARLLFGSKTLILPL